MADENGSVAATIAQSQFGEQAQESEAVENTQHAESESSEHSESQESNVDFSKKFAALSRKEKEFRLEREQYEAEKSEYQALKEEMEAYKAEKASKESKPELPLEYRLKRNPLETLQELGIGYDVLTDLAINDGKMNPEMQMKLMQEDLDKRYEDKYGSKLQELQAKIDAKEQAEEEARVNNAVDDFNNQISSFVNENLEEYELISATKSEGLIYDVIEEHYKDTERILDIKEAADAVESHLLEETQKLSKLKKLSGFGKEAKAEIKPEDLFESPTTLSNVQSASTPKLSERKLSNEESKAAAASLIRWDD